MIRRRIILSLSIVFVMVIASSAFGETVTFVKEYTYQASDFDSKNSSRTLALETVKRLLLEELGTYLVSETEVKNMQLTKDQVTTYSAGIVGAEIIDEKWDGKSYWLRAKVSADPKEAEKSLKKLVEDKSKTQELEETRRKAEELTKQNESLRKELQAMAKTNNRNTPTEAKKVYEYENTIKGLNAIAWFFKGYEASISERWIEAQDALTKAIELNLNYSLIYVAYTARGVANLRLGSIALAIEDFTKAIQLKPDYAEAYYDRGTAYGELLSNYQQAIKDCTKAIELQPDYAEAYANLGLAYMKLGNYQQAIKYDNKAIELKPDDATTYYNRGTVYDRLGNYQQAIKDCTKAIELMPNDPDAYNMRGVAYGKLSNFQQAINDFNKAIELRPDYVGAYFNRGVAYRELGNNQQAIGDFKISARLGDKNAQDLLIKNGIQW